MNVTATGHIRTWMQLLMDARAHGRNSYERYKCYSTCISPPMDVTATEYYSTCISPPMDVTATGITTFLFWSLRYKIILLMQKRFLFNSKNVVIII